MNIIPNTQTNLENESSTLIFSPTSCHDWNAPNHTVCCVCEPKIQAIEIQIQAGLYSFPVAAAESGGVGGNVSWWTWLLLHDVWSFIPKSRACVLSFSVVCFLKLLHLSSFRSPPAAPASLWDSVCVLSLGAVWFTKHKVQLSIGINENSTFPHKCISVATEQLINVVVAMSRCCIATYNGIPHHHHSPPDTRSFTWLLLHADGPLRGSRSHCTCLNARRANYIW